MIKLTDMPKLKKDNVIFKGLGKKAIKGIEYWIAIKCNNPLCSNTIGTHRHNKGRVKYCSASCFHSHRKIKAKWNTRCAQCSNLITRCKSHITAHKHCFCNNTCKGKYAGTHYSIFKKYKYDSSCKWGKFFAVSRKLKLCHRSTAYLEEYIQKHPEHLRWVYYTEDDA
jgi:hypothetical protein